MNKSGDFFSRKTKGEIITFVTVFIIFAIYAASILYILVFIALNSLKTPEEYFNGSFGFPSFFLVSNFSKAFNELTYDEAGFIEMLFNSFWWAGGHVILHLTPIMLFAYVVTRFDFFGKKALLFINYLVIVVTVYGSQSADYVYYADLGILDTRAMVICALGGFGTSMLIIMSFFKTLSWEYAEAAEIDGANEFTIFLKVYIPMLLPMVFSLALIRFISTWNDYYGPLLYNESYPTLASGLYLYRIYSVERKGNYPIYFAGLLIMLLPVLVLYSTFSNVIMKNMGIGGLKG